MLITKKWNVSGGLVHFEKITSFLSSTQEFYGIRENLIDSVFDSHAGLPWNGGRFVDPFHFTVEESVRRVRFYNDLGIRFNIAFSNCQLTDRDLDHADCNWFLQQCHNSMNGIIVASEILRDYLRCRYPDYRVIASIGFNRKDLEFYKQAQEHYDLVVLHPDRNEDDEFIEQLDTSRIEVLVNELCIADCPFRTEHSDYISRLVRENRSYFVRDDEHTGGECLAVERGYRGKGELVVTLERLNRLHGMGVEHFKIQGREHPFEKVVYQGLREYVIKDAIRCLCGTGQRPG